MNERTNERTNLDLSRSMPTPRSFFSVSKVRVYANSDYQNLHAYHSLKTTGLSVSDY